VIAGLMSRGCGIGDSTMQHLVQGISYHNLRTVGDLYLADEDAQRYALRDVVDGISELDITDHSRTGVSSSSDSIRMEYQSKVLNRGFSTCFGDYAIEFYTFVADNFAPYYSKPIECTNRDAGHVLDGILYNESSLTLLDHYVDTHGYMEINYTGFTMVGKCLNPRIKNIKTQQLYGIDQNYKLGSLLPLLSKNAGKLDMDNIIEQYDRMGQFYASLKQGYATASTAMRRLAKFSDKNNFYRANRDFGRIIKTENILLHMTDPALREKRRRGLLKTEQLHQLSREVSYGKHGKITAREIVQLRNSCSCLTLIDACIVYWQAKEIMRVCNECDAVGQGINLHLLKHISPIEWHNLILYGEYFIRKELIR
jgi:TnpA family transposase